MIRKTLVSITVLFSLVFANPTNAQLGFAMPDPVALMAVGIAIEKTDCRTRFPEFQTDIDRAWDVMTQRNLDVISREMWIAFSDVSLPLRQPQSREDCAQMAAKLETADYGPVIAAVRKETACMTSLRAATERGTARRPIIGILLNETTTEAQVAEVDANGPAAVAGVQVGDVITDWGANPTPTKCQLALAVFGSDAGVRVPAVVKRMGAQLRLQIIPGIASE